MVVVKFAALHAVGLGFESLVAHSCLFCHISVAIVVQ